MFYICTMHMEMLNLLFISHFFLFFPNFLPFFHFFTISSPFFPFFPFFPHFFLFFSFPPHFFPFFPIFLSILPIFVSIFLGSVFVEIQKKSTPEKMVKNQKCFFFCKNFANLDLCMQFMPIFMRGVIY